MPLFLLKYFVTNQATPEPVPPLSRKCDSTHSFCLMLFLLVQRKQFRTNTERSSCNCWYWLYVFVFCDDRKVLPYLHDLCFW